MTIGIHELEEMKKRLLPQEEGGMVASSENTAGSVSGKMLFERAQGLFTAEEVDALEKHINESCEQLDD